MGSNEGFDTSSGHYYVRSWSDRIRRCLKVEKREHSVLKKYGHDIPKKTTIDLYDVTSYTTLNNRED